MLKSIAPIILVMVMAAGPVLAAETPEKPRIPVVRVGAEAVVSVKPDRAEITLGVLSRGENAKAAAEEAAKRLAAVLAEVRKAAGPKAEIRTVGYNLHPIYSGTKGKVAAYNVRNMVKITLDDLDRVGPTLDAAVRDGANEVGQVEFSLKDRDAVERQALKLAAEKARAKAESAAAALGASIVRISLLEEGSTDFGGPPRPMFRMAMASMDASAETPMEPGVIDVRSSVTLTVEITGGK